MNIKRYILSVVALFIVFEAINYLVHSVLLTECYTELGDLWRKNMVDYRWGMYLADLLFILFYTSIYTRWGRKFNLSSGMLYGLIVGLMMNTTSVINQWIVYPITLHLMVLWVFFGLIQYVLCGLLLGIIYKPRIEHPIN
jgi:hypothetical protein